MAISKVQVFAGSDGKWYFHTKAGNNRVLDRSQGYTRKSSAKKGAERAYPGRPGGNPVVTYLARPPRTQDALLVELSANCRAVVYGRTGATLLFRGSEVFQLNDLEATKLDAARADFLRKETVPK